MPRIPIGLPRSGVGGQWAGGQTAPDPAAGVPGETRRRLVAPQCQFGRVGVGERLVSPACAWGNVIDPLVKAAGSLAGCASVPEGERTSPARAAVGAGDNASTARAARCEPARAGSNDRRLPVRVRRHRPRVAGQGGLPGRRGHRRSRLPRRSTRQAGARRGTCRHRQDAAGQVGGRDHRLPASSGSSATRGSTNPRPSTSGTTRSSFCASRPSATRAPRGRSSRTTSSPRSSCSPARCWRRSGPTSPSSC